MDASEFMDETVRLKCAKSSGDVLIPHSWERPLSDVMRVRDRPTGFFSLFFVNEDAVPVSFDLQVNSIWMWIFRMAFELCFRIGFFEFAF